MQLQHPRKLSCRSDPPVVPQRPSSGPPSHSCAAEGRLRNDSAIEEVLSHQIGTTRLQARRRLDARDRDPIARRIPDGQLPSDDSVPPLVEQVSQHGFGARQSGRRSLPAPVRDVTGGATGFYFRAVNISPCLGPPSSTSLTGANVRRCSGHAPSLRNASTWAATGSRWSPACGHPVPPSGHPVPPCCHRAATVLPPSGHPLATLLPPSDHPEPSRKSASFQAFLGFVPRRQAGAGAGATSPPMHPLGGPGGQPSLGGGFGVIRRPARAPAFS